MNPSTLKLQIFLFYPFKLALVNITEVKWIILHLLHLLFASASGFLGIIHKISNEKIINPSLICILKKSTHNNNYIKKSFN